MVQQKYSVKFQRQRKFFLLLPLIVLPFFILLFVALGGGKGRGPALNATDTAGFNLRLPDAHFNKGKDKNKLALYEEVFRDSEKVRDKIKNDPYYRLKMKDTPAVGSMPLQSLVEQFSRKYGEPDFGKPQTGALMADPETSEARISQKLNQLKKILHEKDAGSLKQQEASPVKPHYQVPVPADDNVGRLENMMRSINTKADASDPEMNQLNGMLDKILLIQHPENIKDSTLSPKNRNEERNLPVFKMAQQGEIASMDNQNTGQEHNPAFYGLEDERLDQPPAQNTFAAVIAQTQTLVSGATVKIRLIEDIFIGRNRIPANELVYGTATLNNERLRIHIGSIVCKGDILPVTLEVYDLDGMEGIRIPGSINRDASKQSADEAIGSVNLGTIDPSVGAQAATAGIQAAKTLLSKKIKLVRMTVREGYQVILKDSHQK